MLHAKIFETVSHRNQILASLLGGGVFLFSIVYFSLPLSRSAIYTKGEAREALVVRAMVEQDNFVLPRRSAAVVPSKPPFFHWVSVLTHRALSRAVPDEFSLRFPSALASAAALGILAFVSVLSRSPGFAITFTLLLMTSFEWARSSAHARVDMMFAFWLTSALLSMFAISRDLQVGRKLSWPYFAWFSISLGCSALSKGPVGILLPLLIGVIFVAVQVAPLRVWSRVRLFVTPRFILAVLVAVLIAGSWYGLAVGEGGSEFIETQLLKENLARVVADNSRMVGHEKPWYFTFIYLFLAFLPWSVLLPAVCVWLWGQRKSLRIEPNSSVLFALVWVGVFLVAVSFSVSKRVVYFLPALPPLAYLTTFYLQSASATALRQWSLRVISILLLSIGALTALLGIVLFVPFVGDWVLTHPLAHFEFALLSPVARVLVAPSMINVIFFAAGLLLCYGAKRLWSAMPGGAIPRVLFVSLLLMVFLASNNVMPVVAAQLSSKQVFNQLNVELPDYSATYEFKNEYYPQTVYSKAPVRLIRSVDELPKVGKFIVVTHAAESLELKTAHPELAVLYTLRDAKEQADAVVILRSK